MRAFGVWVLGLVLAGLPSEPSGDDSRYLLSISPRRRENKFSRHGKAFRFGMGGGWEKREKMMQPFGEGWSSGCGGGNSLNAFIYG